MIRALILAAILLLPIGISADAQILPGILFGKSRAVGGACGQLNLALNNSCLIPLVIGIP